MEVVNQKEYLKKYLSGGNKDKKKKKRKKKDVGSERVKIIDDDIDISKINADDASEDLLGTNEDAPQIVGVIDDRPMHLRVLDYQQSDLWRPLGASETNDDAENDFKGSMFQKEKEFLLKLIKKDSGSDLKMVSLKKLQGSKNKEKSRWNVGKESVSETVIHIGESDSKDEENSPNRKFRNVSPTTTIASPPRDVDSSPPRKRRMSADQSPPRRSRKDTRRSSDSSPPRKTASPHRSKDTDSSPPRKSKNSDQSPPRRSKKDADRKSRWSSSPTRHFDQQQKRQDHTEKRKLLPGDKKGKYLIPAKRMTKTLDGKKAGLQNAQELVNENETFRKREEDLFKNLPSEVSGVNAVTVVRDRKTGKIRDLKKEEEERLEKQKQEEANKEKYSRWGKGLKQVEEYENKLQQDLMEMNKPLARYADDEDLERHLKEQEREGDPMLDYIRKKRKRKDVETGKAVKPQFEGEFMPNRFGIRPGHRWDGVDRSNGYEKKWIEVQNAKHAIQEEIYKWSTEDM